MKKHVMHGDPDMLYINSKRNKFLNLQLPAFFLILVALTNANFSYSQGWKAYSDSAKIFNSQKKIDEAITYYTRAKEILERDSVYSSAYSQTCISIADIYNASGQQKKVVPFYLEIRETIKKISGKENLAYAVITDRLGQSYISINPTNAEAYFIEAMEIREKKYGKGSLEYAIASNSLGIFYSRVGQFKKAETFYLEAKRIREEKLSKDDPDYARSCNNLASVYWSMGEFEKAEPLALEAKQIREKNPGKASRDYANTCMNLGNIYRDMGQNEKAEAFYIEGKDIREKLLSKKHDDYLEASISLANLYALMKEYEKAEPIYLEVKQTRAEMDMQSSAYALSCNNLGDLYSNMGKHEKAEELLLEAKGIWDKILDKQNSFHPYNRNSLGQLYFAMGQYKKAESYFLEARQLWENVIGKQHSYYMQNTNDLAKVYWNMDEPEKASDFYSQASNAQYNLISKAFQFTNETEKGLYIKNIIGTSDEYYSFYYKKFARNKAAQPFTISLQNRNLILSSAQQMRYVLYNSKDTAVTKTFNDWTKLKEQLAHLYSQSTSKAEQIKKAEEEADNLEKKLTRLSSAFEKIQKKANWQDVQKQLAKNEAAIEFIEFRLYDGKGKTDSILYAALVLKRDLAQPIFVPLFEKRQLNDLFSQNAFDEAAAINHNYTSPDLYNLIWRPVEKYLSGVTKIYFAAAGDLFRISFSALSMNNKKVLGDKYQLIQLNTTAAISNQTKNFITHADKIQLYGGIEYDADTIELKKVILTYHSTAGVLRSLPDDLTRGNSFQYLPGTQQEVAAIKKQADKTGVPATILSGINASEESFDSLKGPASPSVMHIATHGFFFDDPQSNSTDSILLKFQTSGKAFRQSDNPLFRAGLLFAGANNAWRGHFVNGIQDGIVTAFEISNMYFPNTKMVVLSACQTALGDVKGSEGVYGLQRAFKIAGVQNLVMSLWKVPDKETSEFMQEFYKNIFAKQSINDAFYNAQTKMKNQYRAEPYKWAAWILVK